MTDTGITATDTGATATDTGITATDTGATATGRAVRLAALVVVASSVVWLRFSTLHSLVVLTPESDN